jgi:CRISPR-associated protein Cas2
MRDCYVLCYDVSDDARLRRAGKIALQFGYRLQYSVYVCELSDVERSKLERSLNRALNSAEDRALLIGLGPAGVKAESRFYWLCGGGEPGSRERTVVV